ncbi:hypothetical protein OG2516_09845 [Oceanicola granulosus HTCC2516]|uniref:MnmC-like methyltransferase domain-containing protein n=1 Tax=Oceanicola granulosus (strain ATCC BAA-861 / DSM 15982 / KCTC 12143 / HTCC2516) TaxID=314256 RepID=Q2CCT5_OCEGH|nr:tRNA (5-methylaminomethyl-2-thiouridine)(34)-methyltransferase MnmD [Oceanicola granulosus]EAR50538.1 hypothetical protein OG2516_09845 [Oceanicola granulosus HTCC2516]
MRGQSAEIDWKDGTPVARRFDDPYFSLADGPAETAHVFLAGNDLPARFADGFHVAELGFGTGLNFLMTLAAWRAAGAPGRLRFTSFEAYPMATPDLARALAACGAPLADTLAGGVPESPLELADATLTVIAGDARETLPRWRGRADAWFLDGFSPPKNPELWTDALLAEVARHTAPGGTAATYSAAGHVRRALAAAGFAVDRAPGYGRKRHMTRARLA